MSTCFNTGTSMWALPPATMAPRHWMPVSCGTIPYSGRFESTIKTGVMVSSGSLAIEHFPHVETSGAVGQF